MGIRVSVGLPQQVQPVEVSAKPRKPAKLAAWLSGLECYVRRGGEALQQIRSDPVDLQGCANTGVSVQSLLRGCAHARLGRQPLALDGD